jgi:hypothetical protein
MYTGKFRLPGPASATCGVQPVHYFPCRPCFTWACAYCLFDLHSLACIQPVSAEVHSLPASAGAFCANFVRLLARLDQSCLFGQCWQHTSACAVAVLLRGGLVGSACWRLRTPAAVHQQLVLVILHPGAWGERVDRVLGARGWVYALSQMVQMCKWICVGCTRVLKCVSMRV